MKKTIRRFTAICLCVSLILGNTAHTGAAYLKKPGKVSRIAVAQKKANVVIQYKKAANAKKYLIYRSTKKSSAYKKISTTAKLKYTDKTTVAGTTYYYKVRAANTKNSKVKYGSYSSVKKIKIKLPVVDDDKTQNISNINSDTTIKSNLTKEEDWIKSSKSIDDSIQKKAAMRQYSFENPYIIVNPYGYAPLTAVVAFSTDKAYSVKYTVKGNTSLCDVSGSTDAATVHAVPIIGLYANKTNTVELELLENNNVVATKKVNITTGNIPSDVANIVTVTKHSEKSAFGLTLVTGQDCCYPFAYDESGDIRWVITRKGGSNGIFPLSDGKFLFQAAFALTPSHAKPHPTNLYEMDYLGRCYSQFYIAQGVHHDVTEKTPGGNLMVITNSNNGYVEDVVMEIDRTTGKIVKKLDLKKIFGNTYRTKTDWVHINTISYDPDTDTVLLSPRNLHSAIKIHWSTQKLIWIMGNPQFWKGTRFEDKVLKPSGTIQWHYQQHAVYELDDDIDNNPNTKHYIMFDNHYQAARKVNFFDNLTSSYTLIYTVNESTFTIKQEKVFSGLKSSITSNSILDYKTKRVFGMCGHLKSSYNGNKGMIYEYDYNTGKVLNQYAIKKYFYRAYEMTFNCNTMENPLKISERYIKGNLQKPVKLSYNLNIPSKKITSGVNLSLAGNVLYVKANDHSVTDVVFIGSKNTYIWSKSKINQTDQQYLSWNYHMAVPLSCLKSDSYKIVVMYKGKLYKTGKKITCNHR